MVFQNIVTKFQNFEMFWNIFEMIYLSSAHVMVSVKQRGFLVLPCETDSFLRSQTFLEITY